VNDSMFSYDGGNRPESKTSSLGGGTGGQVYPLRLRLVKRMLSLRFRFVVS